ncbi:MAG: hypothetical protein E6H02_08640 [Bacillati bacterium ANGP1]|uniref:Type 4 fimbrial biogenesis protein PilX N-terminal domain-containing protein n=1 Tax=Candidatus Segetimicrobium genomatis TaxID=2569760 RepID=A0A537LPK0_9BACT|nr:MAG: hypothetical protein E6H02_08640 [Terrabacteria group bacterium ANGP1]
MPNAMRHPRALRAARAGEAGIVLIQVIAFSIVLAMITFALVSLSISEYATANSADRGMRALYIADAAVERAIAVLRADTNWNDGVGADKNANNATWQPLWDQFQAGGAGNAVSQTYPAGGGGSSGLYSLYVKRPGAGTYNPADNIWVRAIGQAGKGMRSIEILLHRLTPLDFSVYSAQSYQVSSGGGNVTMHGSAYFYQDLGLKAVKTGVYNDRQILSTDAAPYTNQLYVKGTLDMSTGNPTVGTLTQPMYGVHAGTLNLKGGTGSIHTLELDNVIPNIPYPSVSGYISSLLTNKTYGNVLSGPQTQLVVCTGSGPYTQTWSANVTFGSSYFFIPTQANAGCTNPPTTSADYMLIWDPGKSAPLQLNTAQQSTPVFIPGVVVINQNVSYTGVGTLVVQTTGGGTGLDTGSGQILASNPASYSNGQNPCGYPNPTTMPKTDLLAFVIAGNVTMQGSGTTCSQEQDVVIIAGASGTSTFTSSKKVNVYGVVITEQLDTTQNPDFYQMPDILQNVPGPVSTIATYNTTMPVVVWQWRELLN